MTSVFGMALLGALLLDPGSLLAAAPRVADAAHPGPKAWKFEGSDACGVVAGVLTWKDASYSSYSAENRKERELYETLLARGASREGISLLLDADATRDAVYEAVRRRASAAPAGSTFVFYYAGHGVYGKDGIFLAGYDMESGKVDGTGISPKEVAAIIGRHFRGGRVLMMADCCYSGALVGAAQGLDSSRTTAAALTSASISNSSSGNWTFTQTVIDALSGRGLMDRNGDGVITFGELCQEVADAMRYRERQLSGCLLPGAMRDAVVAAAPPRPRPEGAPGRFAPGEYVSVSGKDGVRVGRILELRGKNLAVEFYDYTDKSVATIPAAQADKIVVRSCPAGPLRKAGVRIVRADSAEPGNEPEKCLDGDPDTIWHTEWTNRLPGYPHELRLETAKEVSITGLRLLPRQDGNWNGWIGKCALYSSTDGTNWGAPLAVSEFERSASEKIIRLKARVSTRHLKLVALSGFEGQVWASLAELEALR